MAAARIKNTSLTRKLVLNLLGKNMGTIKNYGVNRIGIFGSIAQGRSGPSSDVDILVVFGKGKKTFDNYMDLLFFLEKLFGRKVDLVISEAVKPDILPHILESVEYAS